MSPDENYKQLIEEARRLARPAVERNIFSICGRGHYENPISDLLAFFIDPSEEHHFGDLFLTSLFEAAGLTPPTGPCDPPPTREECTSQGNRIDLVVDGDGWVLVIENKIRHQVVNPLDDYVDHVVKRTKTLEGENRHFVILCVREQKPKPKGWHTVTWRSYVDRIKQNFASRLTEPRNMKWQVIMREFLLNVEQECGDDRMKEERIKLVQSNYKQVVELEEMRREYIAYLTELGYATLRKAHCESPDSRQQDWKEGGLAIRFYSSSWGQKTNIALLLRKDGKLGIRVYIYDADEHQAKEALETTEYDKYSVESSTINCFWFHDQVDQDATFGKLAELARSLNELSDKRRLHVSADESLPGTEDSAERSR